MENQEKLTATIKAISDEYWEKHKAPILLSGLPIMLEAKGCDYRVGLGEGYTLKTFIKETGETGGYKLVEHPIQKAKVAVAPIATNFEFPQEAARQSTRATAAEGGQEVTLAFLRALANLPESELDKVVIPVSVLIKLLK